MKHLRPRSRSFLHGRGWQRNASTVGGLSPPRCSHRCLSRESWSLWFSWVLLTAAMFLRPCQAEQTSSCVDLCSTLFFYSRFNRHVQLLSTWTSCSPHHFLQKSGLDFFERKKRSSFLINQRVLVQYSEKEVWYGHHAVLVNKGSYFTVEEAIVWVESYGIDRKQCVVVEGVKSPYLMCWVGVPQGSILRPLLFSTLH